MTVYATYYLTLLVAFISTAELKIEINKFTGLPQMQLVEVSSSKTAIYL